MTITIAGAMEARKERFSRSEDASRRALLDAATHGDVSALERLLDGPRAPPIDATDSLGVTPLAWAASLGEEDAVEMLMERGADVDSADHRGSTPLHKAAARGHEGVVGTMLEGGARTDLKDQSGSTALIEAARSGHRGIVQALLLCGADVDARDDKGLTALMAGAAKAGNRTVVKVSRLPRRGLYACVILILGKLAA
jgi:ankyrin repeat protein